MKNKTMNMQIDIINERIYLYLLSWIKYEEYTNKDSIKENIRLEEFELEKMIYLMQESDLIIQKNGFIFISEYSNSILSAIGVGGDISKKLLSSIAFERSNPVIEDLMIKYQKTHYDKYLTTIGVMKAYNKLTSCLFKEKINEDILSIYNKNIDQIIYKDTWRYNDLYSFEYDAYFKKTVNNINKTIDIALNVENIINGSYDSLKCSIDELKNYKTNINARFEKISEIFSTTMSLIESIVPSLMIFCYINPVIDSLSKVFKGLDDKGKIVSVCKKLVENKNNK